MTFVALLWNGHSPHDWGRRHQHQTTTHLIHEK